MADRDELMSRLSAFASPVPLSRLGAFSDTGRRQSTNIEDVTGAGHLDRALAYLQSSPVALSAILKDYTTPWRYRDMPDTLREISDLLPKQQIPPMRGFAEGGTVADVLSAYSAPVRSWPGEQALDDEARANYQAMHPEAKKLRPDETYRGMFLPFRETTEGKHEWAVPGIFMDPADAAKAIHASSGTSLGAMARPSQLSPEALDEILGIGGAGALTGIMGNMPRVALGPKLARGEFELGSSGSKFGDKGPQMSMSDDASRPPLPMDEASRLARAREMGFNTDQRWVHVTDRDFEAFSKRPKVRNTDEEGMHLARLGTWATDRPAFVSHRTGMDADGGRSIPLYQRGELYDAETLHDLWDMAKERGFKKRLQDEGYAGIRIRDQEFSHTIPSEYENVLQQKIFDLDAASRQMGVEFNEKSRAGVFDKALRDKWRNTEDERSAIAKELKSEAEKRVATSIVMFDPKDLRGVYAPFDPAMSDSAKILASHHVPLPVPREDERILSVDDILNFYAKD